MGLQQQGMKDLPIDISLLPTGEAIAQHLFGTVEISYRVGDRAHMTQSRGPFGPETVIAMAGLIGAGGAMVAYQQQQKAAGEMHQRKSASAAKGDPVKQAKLDLADVGASITVYIITNNKPPAALDELTKPAPDYPKGYTQGQPLPTDPWGHAYAYSTDGKDNYKLWSFGPNGVDDNGVGDDIVAGN
jgi:type II secretory pathway pseudopilin PulG